MDGEAKILQMLEQMNGRLERMDGRIEGLEQGQSEMRADMRKMNQAITKIEVEHGRKINLILENQVDNNRNIEDLQRRMDRVEDKLDGAVIIKAVK